MVFKKTVLPLTHAERLSKHMNIFNETLNNLQELRMDIADDLSEAESVVQTLRNDHASVIEAIECVKRVTG